MNNISGIGKRCCGCGACKAACKHGAIDMRANDEGFLYPAVDAALCTGCGLCLRACPEKAARDDARRPLAAYAARSRDDATIRKSASGGIFYELARAALARGAQVYGAEYVNDARETVVRRAEDEPGVCAMRGSKYMQSRVPTETYPQIKQTLEAGERVLFTGCPCQVAAVKRFLGKEYANLYTADVICHGVPSPALFALYAQYLDKREGTPVANYRFRAHTRGWGTRLSYDARGKMRVRRAAFDPYLQSFLSGKTFRESCYLCPFASPAREGDLTLGDYWGIAREHPGFYDQRGVSLVLVNTEKGVEMFDAIAPAIEALRSNFDRAAAYNRNLLRPCARPAVRDTIYRETRAPEDFARGLLRVRKTPGRVLRALLLPALKTLYQRLKGGKMQ